jgi:hypothetical protein
MDSGAFWELANVADRDLEVELARLLANNSRTEARIIAHLAAVEERRLHLEAGSSSLFDYCCRRLGLSENEAFHRITAARLARRFTAIFGLVERRALHLTAVCLLRDYLTPENHRELLDEASGKRSSKCWKYSRVAFRGQMSHRRFGNCRRLARKPSRLLLRCRIRYHHLTPMPRTRRSRQRGCGLQARLRRRNGSNHFPSRGIGFSSTLRLS